MRKITLCLLLLGVWVCGFGKSVIPPAPNPPRLVNDFAGVISPAQVDDMEQRLVAFNDSTSNVICVVTVDDLGGYSASQFAYEIGDQWGVRSNEKRNGVVILVKPRNDNGGGEVYISVGYDLEGAIPDAIAQRIIEQKMIPELKEEKYGAAIDSALAYILPLAAGEISAKDLENDPSGGDIALLVFILFIIIVVVILIKISKKMPPNSGHYDSGNGRGYYSGPTYMGGYPGKSWGGSWSGGGFGGGGFGGFGGAGGFGGGGAGGHF